LPAGSGERLAALRQNVSALLLELTYFGEPGFNVFPLLFKGLSPFGP